MVVEVVLNNHVEQNTDMGVGNRVEDLSSVTSGSNKTSQPQIAKLMAGGRFRCANQFSNGTDAHLSTLDECVDDLQAVRVRQQLEPFGEIGGRRIIEQTIVRDRRGVSVSFGHPPPLYEYLLIYSDIFNLRQAPA